MLTAGENHPAAEGIAALTVDQADVEQQIEGIAQSGQMTPQVSAGSITDAEFLDQGGSCTPRRSR